MLGRVDNNSLEDIATAELIRRAILWTAQMFAMGGKPPLVGRDLLPTCDIHAAD